MILKTPKAALWVMTSGLFILALPVFGADGGACKADVDKFCSSVDATDHHAVGACLRSHKDDVSADCKAQMAKHHRMKAAAASTTGSMTGSTTSPATGQ